MSRHSGLVLLPLLLLTACGDGTPRSSCGVASLAGPSLLLAEFGVPGQTLGLPPESLPPKLVARMAVGAAMPVVSGESGSVSVSCPEPPGNTRAPDANSIS